MHKADCGWYGTSRRAIEMNYIFVTGGVVSSLGKGIASACIGTILEARGLNLSLIKLDPYINVDPGTMSPFQHGEVYVTEDGSETDLDIGHYERFVNFRATQHHNYTTGQIYERVIRKERQGAYLGATVQVIPHITDEIKAAICEGSKASQIAIIEIGGTVGDIESLPFLEAIRQMGLEKENKVIYIHLTLVPHLKTSAEIKTKPTQHSVKELRSIGIQPDILLCRSHEELSLEHRRKIALFTNVRVEDVISAIDFDSIYSIPLWFHKQKIDELIVSKLDMNNIPPANLSEWERIDAGYKAPKHLVKIALVGKYVSLVDAYMSVNEALIHAGLALHCKVDIIHIDTEDMQGDCKLLNDANGILVPGGFGERGIESKISAARYAREHNIPYLGICLGMQVAVIEFARNVAKLDGADSSEFNPDTPHPVIALATEWQDREGIIQQRNADSDMGGTMRLGIQRCRLAKDSKSYQQYQQDLIEERHRHRYELNNRYLDQLLSVGLKIAGHSDDKELIEIIELSDHPWFVGTQFHPEFTSTPRQANPIYKGFVEAAIHYHQRNS